MIIVRGDTIHLELEKNYFIKNFCIFPRHSHLSDIFQEDFEYADAIAIPAREELQNSENLENLLRIATRLQVIIRNITEHLRILSIEKKLIQMISVEGNEDIFIKRSDTKDIDYHFLVTNLDRQVSWLTNEMVHLKTTIKQKDSMMTKLLEEVLKQNETIRQNSDTEKKLMEELSNLKSQVKEKRWSPSYLNVKDTKDK